MLYEPLALAGLRRSQRPAVGRVPTQLSRQDASLAFSACHSRRFIRSLPVAPHSL